MPEHQASQWTIKHNTDKEIKEWKCENKKGTKVKSALKLSGTSVWSLSLFIVPLGGMLLHCQVSPGTHQLSLTVHSPGVKKSTIRVKCLAREHNTTTPLRLEPGFIRWLNFLFRATWLRFGGDTILSEMTLGQLDRLPWTPTFRPRDQVRFELHA